MTLADPHGVDVDLSFLDTMRDLSESLRQDEEGSTS